MLNDELLSHHINTLKMSVGAGNSVLPYLNEMTAIIRKRVSSFDSEKRTSKRLEALITKLAKEITVPAKGWLKELRAELKSFARYETNYQAEAIGGWVDLDLATPTVEQVMAAARFNPLNLGASPIDYDTLINDWSSDEVNRLAMGVKAGFVEGLSVRQIIKNVVGAGGLADISKRNAMTVAQTTMMQVANEARFAVYRENSDLITGYEIVATLDSRTSDICASYDGQTFKFTDKKQPKPLFHYRCRTTTSPTLSSEFDIFDEGATRASKGAEGGQQVSANKTYYSWLKTQPAQFQDMRLGKTKGAIFRNAGLSPEEFRKITVDDLGRPLTIDEMAQEDARVASYLRKK